VAVRPGGGGVASNVLFVPSLPLPASVGDAQLMSEGVALPRSELRKQAKAGGRSRGQLDQAPAFAEIPFEAETAG
jgi:hypothetical protein